MNAKDLYEICRNWLQFAEAKNGFALAFCGAVIAAEATLLSDVEAAFKPFVLLSMFFVATSAICSLLSFAPRKTVLLAESAGHSSPMDIVYFGQIAQYNRAGFVARASQVLEVEDTDVVSAELLIQCHILSIITVKKLQMFYASMAFAGLGIILPLVTAAGRWLYYTSIARH